MELILWKLASVVSLLMVPPAIFFLLIGVGLSLWDKRGWARWLTIASFGCLVISAMPVVGLSVIRVLEAQMPPLNRAQVNALPRDATTIVVLTSGKIRGALEYPDGETATPGTIQRGRYGAWIAKQTGLPLAIAGGKPAGGGPKRG